MTLKRGRHCTPLCHLLFRSAIRDSVVGRMEISSYMSVSIILSVSTFIRAKSWFSHFDLQSSPPNFAVVDGDRWSGSFVAGFSLDPRCDPTGLVRRLARRLTVRFVIIIGAKNRSKCQIFSIFAQSLVTFLINSSQSTH